MKKLCLLALFVLSAIGCTRSPYEQALRELDANVARRKEYTEAFLTSLEPLYGAMRAADSDSLRFVCSTALADSYLRFSIDSVMKYSELMGVWSERSGLVQQKYLDRSYKILLSRISRNYTEGLESAEDLDPSLMEEPVRLKYYSYSSQLYYSLMIRAASKGYYLNHTWEEYREMLRSVRTASLAIDSTSTDALFMRYMELRDDAKYADALGFLQEHEGELTGDAKARSQYYRQKAVLASHIPGEDRNFYLVQSADYEILSGSRDMLSLSELVRNMTDNTAHIQMAARFVYAAADASARYKYPSRVNWAIDSLSIVTSALAERNRSVNVRLRMLAVVLFLLLAGTLVIMSYNVRLRKRLHRSNSSLSEANTIKNNYLFRYMIQLSENFATADNYHKELRRLAKSEGTEELLRMLRAPSRFEADRKVFYYEFDRMFLSVFPGFVEGVNALMKSGNAYEVSEDGLMSTELRVLAILRLGMSDSRDMARFLGCALSTVFTYRSRAAEKSLYDRAGFEEKIRSISIE